MGTQASSPACSTKTAGGTPAILLPADNRIACVRFPKRFAGFRPLSFWNMQAMTPALPWHTTFMACTQYQPPATATVRRLINPDIPKKNVSSFKISQ